MARKKNHVIPAQVRWANIIENIVFWRLIDKNEILLQFWLQQRLRDLNSSVNQSIQFWSGFISVNGGGRIYPTLTAISPTSTPTLHLARFKASSLSKPTLLLSFSTCIFHVFFGLPRFLLPFTSNSNAFLRTCPLSLLNKCQTISLHMPLWKHKQFYGFMEMNFKNI